MAELKPCPFCGGEAKAVLMAVVRGVKCGHIRCTKCNITQDPWAEGDLDKAIEAWNRRADNG